MSSSYLLLLTTIVIHDTVNLGENEAAKTHQNNIKASVECQSTNMIVDEGISRRYDSSINKLVMDVRATYADVVKMPSREEIVRQRMNIELASPESQALGKLSGRSFAKLIKI